MSTQRRPAARALVVVDVQPDFCEGGALAVAGGDEVARAVAGLVAAGGYARVVATQDWHVDPGDHFAAAPDFVTTWPVHCLAGSDGARLHPALPLDRIDQTFRKGEHQAAYSGFEGHADDGRDLATWLRDNGISDVDVVGVATDHCVRATALDAVRAGLGTRVLLQHTAGVAADSTGRALRELRAAGAVLVGEPVVRAR